jgi:hypothetical protein
MVHAIGNLSRHREGYKSSLGRDSRIPGEYEPKNSLLNLKIVQMKETEGPGKRKERLYRLADMNEATFGLVGSILEGYKNEGEP